MHAFRDSACDTPSFIAKPNFISAIFKIPTYFEGDEIAEDFENNSENWVEASAEEQEKLRRTLKKSKEMRITLRIDKDVLKKIKIKAQNEGLPYQTYINSVLYKQANSRNELQVLREEILAELAKLENELEHLSDAAEKRKRKVG
jgi:predicted DNA binding CopG/RHH family protein